MIFFLLIFFLKVVKATSGTGGTKTEVLSSPELHASIDAIKASSSDKTAKNEAKIFISSPDNSSPKAIAKVEANTI
ncbi:hypothetical protein J0L31_15695 [Terrisporobacter glycolicus]|nr:hypothetical protein [Terrisporobacter glycolicus]